MLDLKHGIILHALKSLKQARGTEMPGKHYFQDMYHTLEKNNSLRYRRLCQNASSSQGCKSCRQGILKTSP